MKRAALSLLLAVTACDGGNAAHDAADAFDAGDASITIPCQVGAETPDFVQRLACTEDFDALASAPLDTSIPGARSIKVVLDRLDDDALYFQNSRKYRIHHEFASAHLSGRGHPVVPALSDFNRTEYYSPDRRLVLGAVTYYEGPGVWALEIAPYDTATADLIAQLFRAVRDRTWFGDALRFHPTSEAVAAEAARLPDDIPLVTTDELFAGIDYQPLNLGTTIGRLRFVRAADLGTEYLSFRDVVVLDHVPNDISVVSGLITEELQTPLSHVNVLSQNRGTPNMALRGATTHPTLRALDGKWVRLTVGAFEYTIEEATAAEAEAFWEQHKPDAVQVPRLDTSVTDLRDLDQVVAEDAGLPLRDAIKAAIPAFGGKTAHYAVMATTEGVQAPRGFAIPVHYYVQFLDQNGFADRIDALLADPTFRDDPAVRDRELKALRKDMEAAPVDEAFQALLRAKWEADFPGQNLRFRSSTNAEDLDGFTGAGLYTSKTGEDDDWDDVLNAIRDVWASVWFFRAFEERTYRSIDHRAVGMALLVHPNFPDEAANGVALTANPFDPSGLEPGFYINVQLGEASVVQPDPGVTTDQYIHHFTLPGQPLVYLSRSNLVPPGTSVLTPDQVFALGAALDAIHRRFAPAYGQDRTPGTSSAWYAMDVEFKIDGDPPAVVIKQARPHPGRGR